VIVVWSWSVPPATRADARGARSRLARPADALVLLFFAFMVSSQRTWMRRAVREPFVFRFFELMTPPVAGASPIDGEAAGHDETDVCAFRATRNQPHSFDSLLQPIGPDARTVITTGQSTAPRASVATSNRRGLCRSALRQRSADRGASVPG
jgi:hypothetical protein